MHVALSIPIAPWIPQNVCIACHAAELVSKNILHDLTDVRLHQKMAGGVNACDVGHRTKQFLDCLGAVQAKLWKYVFKHVEFAK